MKKQPTLGEAATEFATTGTANQQNVEKLKEFLLAEYVGKEPKAKIQRWVAYVLQKSTGFLEKLNPFEEVQQCLDLIEIFHHGYDFLTSAAFLDQKDLPYDRITFLQLSYHFIKVCIVKISNCVTKNVEIRELTEAVVALVQVLQRDLKAITSEPEIPNIELYFNICQSFYSHFYNTFAFSLDSIAETLVDDVFRLLLLGFPLKSFKLEVADKNKQFADKNKSAEQNEQFAEKNKQFADKNKWEEKNKQWAERLGVILPQVIQRSQESTALTISEEVVEMLKNCANLGVEHLLAIFSKLASAMAGQATLLRPCHFTEILSVWNNYLETSEEFKPAAIQIQALLKATGQLQIYNRKIHLISGALKDLMKQNQENRRLIQSQKPDSIKSKLNFDGEIEERLEVSVAHETLSRSDEESLMQPLISAVESVAVAFKTPNLKTSNKVWTTILRESAAALLECCYNFQTHRMDYYSLMSVQLAWKLLDWMENRPIDLWLAVGSAYIRTLCGVRLFIPAVAVAEFESEPPKTTLTEFVLGTKKCADTSDCLKEQAIFLVEICWLHLLTRQDERFNEYFTALHNLLGATELSGEWKNIFTAQFYRLKAYAFIAGAFKSGELENDHQTPHHTPHQTPHQTPLSLLESARDEICAASKLETSGDISARRLVGILYLTLCCDLSRMLLNIGAPVEARPFAQQGSVIAKKSGSRRWTAIFGLLEAQCLFNYGKLDEFRTTLAEVDLILAGKGLSILPTLEQLLKSKSTKFQSESNFESLASDIHKISLDDERQTESESNSENDGFVGKLVLNVGQCRFKLAGKDISETVLKKKKDFEICDCEDCRDFDLQISLMECLYLKYISNNNAAEKRRIWEKGFDVLKNKLGYSPQNLLHKLSADGIIKVGKSACLRLMEGPSLKLRLRSVIVGLQSFRFPIEKNLEEQQKFDESFAKLKKSIKSCGDVSVLHPEIPALMSYSRILYDLIAEIKSVKEFRDCIKSKWSLDYLAEEIENHPFRGVQPGNVIEDSLTKMFGKSCQMETQKPKLIVPQTPAKETPAKETRSRKDKFGAPERERQKRHAQKPGEEPEKGEEPEMPAEMEGEVAEQQKKLARRRMTMASEAIASSDEFREDAEFAKISSESSARIPPESSKDGAIRGVISQLKKLLEEWSRFPLYPYFRNVALLLTMLSGINEDREWLADISSSATSGKLHHLAILKNLRVSKTYLSKTDLSKTDPSEVENAKSSIAHLTFQKSSTKILSKLLPPDWIVCSISLLTQTALTLDASGKSKILGISVTRWERKSTPITIVLRVPEGSSSKILTSLLEVHQRADKNQHNYKDAKDYWRTRLELNLEMSELAENLEQLLGFAKALLLTFPTEKSELKDLMKKMKELKADSNAKNIEDHILRVIALAGLVLPSPVLSIHKESIRTLISLLIHQAKNSLEVNPLAEIAAVDALTEIACRKTVSREPFSACYKRSPLILVLDNESYQLPWESIPTLRNHPVSRMPSIKILALQLEKCRELMLKRNRGFFILNPDSDLKKMQTTFSGLFDRLKSSNWQGVAGAVPSSEEILEAFKEREMILYMGHGSGSHIFSQASLDKHRTQASMFLIGCSSVQLRFSTWMDSTGFLEQCVMMGSPCVMGNLWTVTSGCIDSLISSVLESLMKEKETSNSRSFLELLALSRDGIKSNYLVGAAPVIIGLPIAY